MDQNPYESPKESGSQKPLVLPTALRIALWAIVAILLAAVIVALQGPY